jgi:alpha-L-rhamnosidase
MKSIHNSDTVLTAGDIGFNYLVKALQNNGQGELLFEMNARDDVPAYGYQLKKEPPHLPNRGRCLRRYQIII